MNSSKAPAFREDIQALRGLAILLVLLHHAKLDFLKVGYLGVDIFFVISGYLITQIIRKDLESGTFSFSAFYFRRAKRLLPAAYVTLVVTTLLSGAFLTQSEARDFFKQLVGAVTFTGNIALWLQTGYFEGAANLKPLLHVWSLAIEEQYYMLLPAAMVLAPRRYWRPSMAVLLILSMALCFALAGSKPGATFYLLPTRGWELALGSLGALVGAGRTAVSEPNKRFSSLVWPAVLLLVVIPAVPTGVLQPWGDAVIVCVATLVVILGCHPALVQSPALIPLARLGDFSYSLYLVHWPLFAFANNAYVSPVPMQVNIGLALVALGLGYALYRYVELPVRRAPIELSKKSVGTIVAASVALVLISVGVTKLFSPAINYADVLRVNTGFGPNCEFDNAFRLTAACSNSSTPRILVWGDSFAMHLVPGIVATTQFGVAQATKSVCGPFVDLAPIYLPDYPRPWAEKCLQFNQSVLAYLAKANSVEYVILASPFSQYLGGKGWKPNSVLLRTKSGEFSDADPSVTLAIQQIRKTVSEVRALGKKVVVVAPPPSSGFNVGRCLELQASDKLIFGSDDGACRISTALYHKHQQIARHFLSLLPGVAGVGVVGFEDFLCSAQTCETEVDGVFLYRDEGHLSIEGSRRLASQMEFANRLISAAK